MLITEDYKEQNRLLHEDETQHYGVAGKAFVHIIKDVYARYDCFSILDYGCGKGSLSKLLPRYRIRGYDPAIPEFSTAPDPADFVACLDVMEHIEPDCLDAVLDHIRDLTERVCLMSISLRKAHKNLPDGRNAHLIVEHPHWWLERLMKRSNLEHYERGKDFMWVILT